MSLNHRREAKRFGRSFGKDLSNDDLNASLLYDDFKSYGLRPEEQSHFRFLPTIAQGGEAFSAHIANRRDDVEKKPL